MRRTSLPSAMAADRVATDEAGGFGRARSDESHFLLPSGRKDFLIEKQGMSYLADTDPDTALGTPAGGSLHLDPGASDR